MKLIGREKEQYIFNNAMQSSKSEMVTVIGRRRVGKTFLIRKYFEKDIAFEFTGIYNGTLAEHINRFTKAYTTYFKNAPKGKLKNWFDVFDHIEIAIDKIKRTKKKVIFLDELPWMGGSNSQFIKALSAFWNSWASKREDIVLVISGSSTSWMVKKIFNDKGGLHNRTTQRIQLKPFTLKETEQFLQYKKCTLQQAAIADIYMCLGGIPYYLEYIQPNESVAQIIEKLFFRKTANLQAEFEELFFSQFLNPEFLVTIVTFLAKHHYGLNRNQLLKLIKRNSGGNFTKALADLEHCGFISSYISYNKINKDKIYKLTDSFTLFYLRYVSTKNKLTQWKKIIETPSYKSWTGFAFENLCLQNTLQIEKALKIDGINTRISSWQHKGSDEMKGAQIDLLIDRDDKIINVCEIKYYNTKLVINKEFMDKLETKIGSFQFFSQTSKNIFPVLICPFGVHQNKYIDAFTQSIVTLKDLFQ
jgi:AAA+ ATPase superfamily predicted ATPase